MPQLPLGMMSSSSFDNLQGETHAVEVYCRLKPMSQTDDAVPCITQISPTTVECNINGARPGALPPRQMRYQFTRVFHEQQGQECVFEEVAKPLLSELVQGKNALLFTYGVTGSGKTYTMQGNSKEPGILPRALDVLFNSIGDQQTMKYLIKPDSQNGFLIQTEVDAMMERQSIETGNRLVTCKTPKREAVAVKYLVRERSTVPTIDEKCYYAVFISFVEVYNNYVFDLLQDSHDSLLSSQKAPSSLTLREEGRRVFVAGATEVEVKSSDEALRLFLAGQQRRRVAQTILNAESSRSHSVFTVRLVRAPLAEAPGGDLQNMDRNQLIISQFSFVDLAGSERTGRTGNQGERLREASNINNSLMTLRKCLEILRENQRMGCKKVVPYREQRLTYLFRNYFEGDGHVRILACISAAPQELDETLLVLKFAENSQELQTFRTPLPPARVAASETSTPCPTPTKLSTRSDARRAQGGRKPEMGSDEKGRFPLNLWDEVVSDVLLRPVCHFPFPSEVSPSYLADHAERIARECREYINQRRHLSQTAVQGITKQVDTLRERLQWLSQTLERNAVDERQISRLHDSLERERTKNNSLETKCRNLQAELENAKSTLREERVERDRQIERLRSHATQLRHQQQQHGTRTGGGGGGGPITAKVHVTRHTPAGQEESNFKGSTRDLASSTRTPGVTRLQNRKIVSTLAQQWEDRSSGTAALPPTSKASTTRLPANPRHTPAIGKKRHSRSGDGALSSCSGSSGTWIEHHARNATPMGTLLSPKIKKRKSVTKLTYEDTLKASNYVLTHQQTDADGNIEMQLYKGALIPTAGGGTACIFNDVELLTQRPPLRELNPSSASDEAR